MLKQAVAMQPAGIIDEVKKAGLRGRGGAHLGRGASRDGRPLSTCPPAPASSL